jgi:hypothetical protein
MLTPNEKEVMLRQNIWSSHTFICLLYWQ